MRRRREFWGSGDRGKMSAILMTTIFVANWIVCGIAAYQLNMVWFERLDDAFPTTPRSAHENKWFCLIFAAIGPLGLAATLASNAAVKPRMAQRKPELEES